MDRLNDWTAQRAGAGMTLVGRTLEGTQRRVTGVSKIVAREDGVYALIPVDGGREDDQEIRLGTPK